MSRDNLPEPKDKAEFMDVVESLRPDLLYPDDWSDQQQKALDSIGGSKLRTKKAMFAGIPMICSPNCPVRESCPLYKEKRAPYTKKCPLELKYIMDLAQSLIEELAVDPDDLLELSQIRALVNQEIQYMRATAIIAQEGFTQENPVGVDDQGRPIMKTELNLAVEMEDRILKRKKDLQNQLLASREAKMKAGQVQRDQVLAISDLLSDLKAQDKTRDDMVRKKLGIIDVEPEEEDDD